MNINYLIMEDAIRQRINEILSFYEITINRFSNGDSALQNRLSRQLSRGSAITSDTICLILSRFSDVSSEWLLRGEGEMFKPQQEQTSDPQPALINAVAGTPEASVLYQIYNDTIIRMKKLVEENANLKNKVAELSEDSEQIANLLRDIRNDNKRLDQENRELRIEVMIKDAQLSEKEKAVSDYKDILKEAI